MCEILPARADVGKGVYTVLEILSTTVQGQTNGCQPLPYDGSQIVQIRVFAIGRVCYRFVAVQVTVVRFDKVLHDPEVALLVHSSFQLLVEALDLGTARGKGI